MDLYSPYFIMQRIALTSYSEMTSARTLRANFCNIGLTECPLFYSRISFTGIVDCGQGFAGMFGWAYKAMTYHHHLLKNNFKKAVF